MKKLMIKIFVGIICLGNGYVQATEDAVNKSAISQKKELNRPSKTNVGEKPKNAKKTEDTKKPEANEESDEGKKSAGNGQNNNKFLSKNTQIAENLNDDQRFKNLMAI
ncbi:MAG: hypothetical protein LBH49_00950, partial [Puniceicoccales bacterium]|nr:hypothetical protein [Puniceicoccales bacterium]